MAEKQPTDVDQLVQQTEQLSLSDLEEQWKKLKSAAHGREMDVVTLFCHCTKRENKKKIQEDQQLKGYPGTHPSYGLLHDLSGVFFMVTLFKGDLPTQSPYGKYRIIIAINSIVKKKEEWSLYFECTYHLKKTETRNGKTYENAVQYIRLVLVKNSQKKDKEWCDKNLHKIDMDNNPVLKWVDDKVYCITAFKAHNPYRFYTEVFVVGDVSTQDWDKVSDTGRSTFDSFTRGVYSTK